jgi:hypothetical protein
MITIIRIWLSLSLRILWNGDMDDDDCTNESSASRFGRFSSRQTAHQMGGRMDGPQKRSERDNEKELLVPGINNLLVILLKT